MTQNASERESEARESSKAGPVRFRTVGGRIVEFVKHHLIAILALLVSVYAAYQAERNADQARRSADASAESARAAEAMVEETRAPDVDAEATFVETPVPNPSPWIRTGTDGDSVPIQIYKPFLGSKGVWHVSIQNNGDAVAKNVRIRAPGIFYARHVGFATGAEINWSRVESEEFTVGDLGPQQLFRGVFWIQPQFTLSDSCDEPTTPVGCFTLDDLIVFADNATGDVKHEHFRPPASVQVTDQDSEGRE